MNYIQILQQGVKWKISLVATAVFSISIIISLISALIVFEKDVEKHNQSSFSNNQRIISHLMVLSASHLENISQSFLKQQNIKNAIMDSNKNNLKELFEPHWQIAYFHQNIESVSFFDKRGNTIQSWGVKNEELENKIAIRAIKNHNYSPSFSIINCKTNCIQYLSMPISKQKEIVGGVTIGRPINQIILGFKSISNIDIGILIPNKDGAIPPNERNIKDWHTSISALTNFQYNAQIIKSISEKNPDISNLTKSRIIPIKHENKKLNISLLPMMGIDNQNIAYIITLSQKQDLLLSKNVIYKLIAIGIASIAVSIALISIALSFIRIKDTRLDMIKESLDRIEPNRKS